ncbi:galactosyl transferase [Mycobacterium phage Cornie]|uniref:Galactosyltransferase n=1 Tax=Mycobacterium phage Cornie TaxID=2704043 RepID=A0A6G6XKU5_9CAUD|nr:galactosyl transferase [Mycobacterium phage Cornie]QIG58475.1 galactosyltransferase [Mycobacterium phage Cornie]
MNVSIIIPFRDRGTDPLRKANLQHVLKQWDTYGYTAHVVDDGRTGDAQFNRHAAYNRGAAIATGNILVYTESDMLLPIDQLHAGIEAAHHNGLVVPFTARHELGPQDSEHIRNGHTQPHLCQADIIKPKPRRIGAINIINRATLKAIGQWDEQFEGNWWDDRSMHIAFDRCAGPTRWINGPAWHLYHLPGHTGAHLTEADKAATRRNKRRWQQYQTAHTPESIRKLTTGQT